MRVLRYATNILLVTADLLRLFTGLLLSLDLIDFLRMRCDGNGPALTTSNTQNLKHCTCLLNPNITIGISYTMVATLLPITAGGFQISLPFVSNLVSCAWLHLLDINIGTNIKQRISVSSS